MSQSIFFAYPSEPHHLGQAIQQACTEAQAIGLSATPWPQADVAGQFIADRVLDEIDKASVLIADITRLNFNVTFEVGYAIGRGKAALPVLHAALQPAMKEITQLGIFDSIGYFKYQNSSELLARLKTACSILPLQNSDVGLNAAAPLYVLDTEHKTDAQLRIISKIKKARIRFRSFDPHEQTRLSALDAIKQVNQSVAIVVNLLSTQATDYLRNNLRAAFVMGLASGFGRELLAFQDGEEPVPLDYRDLVRVYKHPQDVDAEINELAPKVMDALQKRSGKGPTHVAGLLEKLDLGAPAAENEMTTLENYYVHTDEYNRTVSGQARLAVGRKGSGKTALFFQVRDKIRRHPQKLVLDLRPEGHQLKRFKSAILDVLTEAVKEHAATAFWEYSLLLEICHKLLENDRTRSRRDADSMRKYETLRDLYGRAGRGAEEGDFSERLRDMIDRIENQFGVHAGADSSISLSSSQVTQLIYLHDIAKIREQLKSYLQNRDDVWILFDNIDKGWPTHGVGPSDIIIVRALLEATRKIEQYFARYEIPVHTVVFLRNDVYELLVNESPDRGKESRVSLDWTDPVRLQEVLRRRITSNDGFDSAAPFQEVWQRICVSHIRGEDSSEYLISRSLMRPRNLLTMVGYAKSNAVNLEHVRMSEDDLLKAVQSFSADVGNEIGLEIRDVLPTGEDILYCFIGSTSWLTAADLHRILEKTPVPSAEHDRLIEMLLWFAFLGIVRDDNSETFIYDVYYDMKKLKALAGNLATDSTTFCIHKAFFPFLDIPEK